MKSPLKPLLKLVSSNSRAERQVDNSMKYKVVAAGLIVILSIVAFGQHAVLAQISQPWFGTWEAVKAIPPDEKLEVKMKTGKTFKGTLTSVSDTGINLGRGSNAVSIARDDIRQVYHATKKSSGKPALTGALVGAAIGAGGIAIAAAADDAGGTDGELAAVLAGVALAGAGVGALIGSIFRNKKKLVLIYESR